MEEEISSQKERSQTSSPVSLKDNVSETAPDSFAYLNAKCILLEKTPEMKSSLYDHLAQLIKYILKTDEESIMERLGEISLKVKLLTCPIAPDLIKDVPEPAKQLSLAKSEVPLYQVHPKAPKFQTPAISLCPDIAKVFFALEQAGLGLPSEEVFLLAASIKKFAVEKNPKKLRFWGKVYGIHKNYYVVEVEEEHRIREMSQETVESDSPQKNPEVQSPLQESDEALESLQIDLLPKSDWRPQQPTPPDDTGRGTNKAVYYVCNSPTEEWMKLPDVTPSQICASRQIRHLCTGDLESKIESFPPFPGVEKNFLRAQIARISATTTISPINYYQFEEEEMEENAFSESFVPNPEYEPLSIYELADSSLANWVHHAAYILPQGRTTWWNPRTTEPNDLEDDDEEMEETAELEPETGPPLLTPLSEDEEIGEIQPWSTRITSQLVPHYAYAVLSSNLWPGSHTIASGRFFENIYIGWAQKFLGTNFSPQLAPKIFEEFPSGPEVDETDDPTAEEEAAWRAAQEEATKKLAEEAEEHEEEEEEDEGDEIED
ncbi:Radial spoke head protein 6 A [Clonorchis sinensis]|uniref:Radial spoke head protein 6 A n=1 Tax=Clonorchis sinensis TaxID=79923 RepID=A0A8T1MQH8_CLOSI|nr:Radial spoke head protein 6 A [Clonorchis sinensis]